MELNTEEIELLRNAPGSIADGGESTRSAAMWELERRGLLRPTFSFNPVHYKKPDASVHYFPNIGYNFTKPVYAYTRTDHGEQVNAFYRGALPVAE